VRASVNMTAVLMSGGKDNAQTQASCLATLGIVLDRATIEAIVPGSPAYHSGGVLKKGDVVRKVGTVMVTERDVKDVLGRYYQHVGTDVIVGVKKRSGDNAEVMLRTIDSEHFKYQIMMTEAIAKVSTSVRRKTDFAYNIMKQNEASDPSAEENADTFRSLKDETNERVDVLLSVFSKREYDRVEREKQLLQEIKRLRDEGDLFKLGHSSKKKQVLELEETLFQTQSQLSKMAGEDMQSTLSAVTMLQQEKAQLQDSLKIKDKQITALVGHDNTYQVAIDKVASLTEVTLTQTAEIFRLNEMVIRMDSELREVRSKLHNREMGIEEAMMRWHADDGEDPFGEAVVFEPNRSLAGVWVPLS